MKKTKSKSTNIQSKLKVTTYLFKSDAIKEIRKTIFWHVAKIKDGNFLEFTMTFWSNHCVYKANKTTRIRRRSKKIQWDVKKMRQSEYPCKPYCGKVTMLAFVTFGDQNRK